MNRALLLFLLFTFSCSQQQSRSISSTSLEFSGCHKIFGEVLSLSEQQTLARANVDEAIHMGLINKVEFDEIRESKVFSKFIDESQYPEVDQLAVTLLKKSEPDLPDDLVLRKIRTIQEFCGI